MRRASGSGSGRHGGAALLPSLLLGAALLVMVAPALHAAEPTSPTVPAVQRATTEAVSAAPVVPTAKPTEALAPAQPATAVEAPIQPTGSPHVAAPGAEPTTEPSAGANAEATAETTAEPATNATAQPAPTEASPSGSAAPATEAALPAAPPAQHAVPQVQPAPPSRAVEAKPRSAPQPVPSAPAAKPAAAIPGGPELIAVLDLDVLGASAEEGAAVTERLRETLFDTGRFTLVNRGQIKQILDEQALQQTGCTGTECAVRVGRILGVRRIVTGRITKIPPRAWQASVQVVDVETAETLEDKTLYLEGSLAALLSDGVPRLARALAGEDEDLTPPPDSSGLAEPVAAAPQPRPVPRRPPAATPPDGALRVAILPAYVDGALADEVNRRLPNFMAKLGELGETSRRFVITHSFYPAAGAAGIKTRGELEERAWQGMGQRARPDLAYIQRLGRSLGVDVALLYRIRAGARQGGVRVYVVDVASGNAVVEEARSPAERLATVLQERTRRAVRVYLVRYEDHAGKR